MGFKRSAFTAGVKFGFTDETLRQVDDLKARIGARNFSQIIVKFMQKEAKDLAKFIRKNFAVPPRIDVHSKELGKGIEGRASVYRGVPTMKVGVYRGPALPYAGYQELGTTGKGGDYPTIYPRRRKALAAPGPDVLTASGVDKYGGPRKYPGKLVFIPFQHSPNPNVIGGLYSERKLRAARRRRGADGSLRQLLVAYFLLRKVDIRPHNFLRDGFLAFLPGFKERFAAFLTKVWSFRARGSARESI